MIEVSTGDGGDTVTVVAPVTEPEVAVTVVVPAATAVKSPVEGLIVPTDAALDVHVTVVAKGWLN